MKSSSKTAFFAHLALFSAALIWGSSFFMMKNAVGVFSPNLLLGIRFTAGCLLLALIFCRRLPKLNRTYLWQGGVLGTLLFAAYWAQTVGLTGTTPGKNAFLTAAYCVLVPLFAWLTGKRRPGFESLAAALLCLGGIGLISLNDGFSISWGDGMTLVGAVFYAAHMVAVARFSREKDPILLTLVQFGTAAVWSWGIGLATERWPAAIPSGAVWELVYLAVFATTAALLLQNIGQKYADPTAAAILLSLESVFGVLFSLIFYQEKLTLRLGAGFALVFGAVLLSELKPRRQDSP